MYQAFTKQLSTRDFFNNTNISLKNKYIYFATGKVANSTIKYILQTLELDGTPFQIKNIHDRLRSPLLSPFQLSDKQFLALLKDKSVTKFGFVRNPYTRLLSAYLDRVCRPTVSRRRLLRETGKNKGDEISFVEFLEYVCQQADKMNDPHWRPQSSELLVGVAPLSYVGRFENFQADAQEILCKIFPDREPFIKEETSIVRSPTSNKTATLLHQYFDGVDLDMVLKKYGKDFKNFDYSTKLDDAVNA